MQSMARKLASNNVYIHELLNKLKRSPLWNKKVPRAGYWQPTFYSSHIEQLFRHLLIHLFMDY